MYLLQVAVPLICSKSIHTLHNFLIYNDRINKWKD